MTELMSKITNEQTLANCFHGDNWIGAAERDYYLNADHEICQCASLNRRIPGRYGFIPGYSFYMAKERICTDLYFNLGNPPDRSLIVVQYDGIKAAEASPFVKDFLDLKKNIEDTIQMLKDNTLDPYEIGGSLFSYTPERTEGRFMTLTYTMCECPIRERQEFVQFYVSGNKLKHLSVSKEPLEDMMRFFPDFDTLDRTELHLRTFLNPENDALKESSLYHEKWLEARESIEFDRG